MTGAIAVNCNGAPSRGAKRALNLEYRPDVAGRNVRLELPAFVQDLQRIPPRTLDLLELAAYVFAADRNTKRGSKDAVEYHSWSREFQFRMRVRDVDFWSRPDVRESLQSCLAFMTGHKHYSFSFLPGHTTPPTSLFDREGYSPALRGISPQLALFSGGLDSLSGAVDALCTTDKSLVLISHRSQPGTMKVQRALTKTLSDRFQDRVIPYGFDCTLSGERAAEETQRSRSFLYASIGFAIAQAYGTNELAIYENGVTSLNLRRREDLANARSSRTTHPKVVSQLQSLLSLIAESKFTISTPAFLLTKKQTVQRLIDHGFGDLIATSVSCSRTFQREENTSQCGRCFQCVDRRLAMFAAGGESLDDSALYSIDVMREAFPDAESRTMAVDYLRQAARFAEHSVDAFAAEYVTELSEVLDFLPMAGADNDRIDSIWRLLRAHGQDVRNALVRVREMYDNPMRPHVRGSLPHLIASREHLRPSVARAVDAISALVQAAIGPMFRRTAPKNENDLNDKLAALIGSQAALRSEHPTAPFACARVIPDHQLSDYALLIETKYIRGRTSPSKASDGIAADITKYPVTAHVLFLVYDPTHSIPNDDQFRRDFEATGRCTISILR